MGCPTWRRKESAFALEKERDTLDKLHREACDHIGRLTSQVTELTRQRDTFERQALESGKRLDEARNVIADMTIARSTTPFASIDWAQAGSCARAGIRIEGVRGMDPDRFMAEISKNFDARTREGDRDEIESRIAAANDLKRQLERALIDLRETREVAELYRQERSMFGAELKSCEAQRDALAKKISAADPSF